MRTQTRPTIIIWPIYFLAAFLVSGCGGDFSYKRGAGMADFDKEREECADQNVQEYEIQQCLSKSGWVMVGAEKPLVKEQVVVADKPAVVEQPGAIITPDGRAVVVDITPVEITTNPLETINVNSWWKAGAGAGSLMSDGGSCVLELGEEFEPQANFSIVTMGLHTCMKGKGWFALEAK